MSNGKKVLYITYDGMTDPLGQSQVIPYLEIMSREGYSVTLLSTEKKDRYEKGKDVVEKILLAANISWEPVMFHTKPPLVSKIYDQWQLNTKARQLHRAHHFDFIHCRSYVPAASAMQLKEKFGVPFLFDMRGFWVDERVDNGQWDLKKPFYRFLYKRYKKKEQKYLLGASQIIVLTEKGKRELLDAYHVPEEKITVIPCCADLAHFDSSTVPEEEKKKLKAELGISKGTKVLSYLGSLGGWYLTDEMLDFFKVMKDRLDSSIFLFITHNDKEGILRKAASKGIEEKYIRVRAASRQEVPKVLAVSDWSIFFIKDAYSKKASSPTKQGEIMAMGIPVICNDIGDTGLITEQSQSGVVVKEFSQTEYSRIVDAIEQLDNYDRSQIRRSAFQYYDLCKAGTLYSGVYRKMSKIK
jgi:glycosyltransferase involved in cell wall biosynthesis